MVLLVYDWMAGQGYDYGHHRRRSGFCGMLLSSRIAQLPHCMILDHIK